MRNSSTISKKKPRTSNRSWQKASTYTYLTKNLGLTETGKVFYRCIKYRLSCNDCFNRGFIFDDPMLGDKDLDILFKPQSKRSMKRKRPKPKKEKKKKRMENSQDQPAKVEDVNDAGEEEQAEGEEEQGAEEQGKVGAAEAEEEQVAEEEAKEEEEEEPEAGEDEDEEGKPKLEYFTPESIIFFEKEKDNFQFYNDSNDERKESIQAFFDVLKAETLTIDLTKLEEYEGMEDLRLYIERVASYNLEQPPK